MRSVGGSFSVPRTRATQLQPPRRPGHARTERTRGRRFSPEERRPGAGVFARGLVRGWAGLEGPDRGHRRLCLQFHGRVGCRTNPSGGPGVRNWRPRDVIILPGRSTGPLDALFVISGFPWVVCACRARLRRFGFWTLSEHRRKSNSC